MNACVSHEMRNPINAIFATSLKLKESVDEFKLLMDKMFEIDIDDAMNEHLSSLKDLHTDIMEMQKMQESATKFLNFYVGDLLCLA